jgi:hypothetical protein
MGRPGPKGKWAKISPKIKWAYFLQGLDSAQQHGLGWGPAQNKYGLVTVHQHSNRVTVHMHSK